MSEIKTILEEGFSLESLVARISLPGLVATLSVALLCALIIYFAYRFFYPGAIYSANFNLLLVLVTLITAMIIMTISSNIVLSLGMVGALSIVRFRAAVKDPLDIGFLFLGIGAGLTAGAGLFMIAVCGTVFILLVFVLMSLIKSDRRKYLLILQYDHEQEEALNDLLTGVKTSLKNKTITDNTVETTYEITHKYANSEELAQLQKSEIISHSVLMEFTADHTV